MEALLVYPAHQLQMLLELKKRMKFILPFLLENSFANSHVNQFSEVRLALQVFNISQII